ncbi:MAG: DUF1501 domain-containing protein [Chitinophagaceae bacterium]
MKRRDFLKIGSMASLAYTMNGLPIHAYGKGLDKKTRSSLNGNILVLIRLNGGNDGLNTLIPLDKYSELSNARANILIPQGNVLGLTGTLTTGLHPSMTAMRDLYNNGKLNIIQAVSYPDPNFSHFRSTDIMNSASDSSQYLETGWIGRFIDNRFPNAPQDYPNADFVDPLSIEIGSNVSSMLSGQNGLNGLAISNINSFYNIVNGTVDPAPNTPAGHELTYIRFIIQQTKAYTQVIEAAAQIGTNAVLYPNYRLADQLKIVARLISGGMQTPVYIVNIGGFDTHDNQVDTANVTLGQHANLLKELSDSIGVFQQDLEAQSLDQKVSGCTITEFGRRIKSNASIGTDHGTAAPMFVFGSNVNPTVIGSSPNIPSAATTNDNLPMQHDFRQVYATILSDWFDLPPSDTQSVMDGKSHAWLPIFKWATPNQEYTPRSTALSLEQNFPNPFKSHTTIRFTSEGGMAQIVLYDDMGRMLKTIYENTVPAGTFEVSLDRETLKPGNYFYSLRVESSTTLTRKLTVIF